MGNIQEMGSKINAFFRERKGELYTLLIILLVAFLAFGLGRLSVYYGEKGELKIEYPENQSAAAGIVGSAQVAVGSHDVLLQSTSYNLPPSLSGGGGYVASRTGTAYYFPWCGIEPRIKPESRLQVT